MKEKIQSIYRAYVRRCMWLMLLVLLSLPSFAQDDAGFTADRPGATTGTDVLPKGRMQWETGMGMEKVKVKSEKFLSESWSTTWTVNTSLLRWGFSDTAELRVQGDWLQTSADGEHYGGLANVAVGTKVRIYDGWRAWPAISLLGNVLIPGGSHARYLPAHWGGQMGLLLQHPLTSWLSLGYEADLHWSDAARPTVFFGLCLGFSLAPRLSLAVEEYNYNTSDGTDCWTEIALSYQLAPRLQLDLGTDVCLRHFRQYHNVMVGVAWQITK